mmetsp:Transcript_30268/g.43262  ORF Transcript_30268/g.43262 Transcript_30268/m.43262 type:complete len:147 (+) Transcript_30268:19-459(+)
MQNSHFVQWTVPPANAVNQSIQLQGQQGMENYYNINPYQNLSEPQPGHFDPRFYTPPIVPPFGYFMSPSQQSSSFYLPSNSQLNAPQQPVGNQQIIGPENKSFIGKKSSFPESGLKGNSNNPVIKLEKSFRKIRVWNLSLPTIMLM